MRNILTDAACNRSVERLTKLSDGGGLQLWVWPAAGAEGTKRKGPRRWRLAYRFAGKQKLLSLGVYPTVSLKAARAKRDELKALLAAGNDPALERKRARAEGLSSDNTFRALADSYVIKREREGRRDSTLSKLRWLLSFADPTLGSRKIKEIVAPDILAVLQKVEREGHLETARRLRGTIGSVFRFAMAQGKAFADPTIALHGALAQPVVKHRAAVIGAKPYGALLRAIDGFDGQPTTHVALKLMALLFPRPGELRGAEWSEFDLGQATWTIPEARMKMKRAHRKPLSRQAVELLTALRPITGQGRFVFPSVRTSAKPLSETTLNAALRRLGYGADEATAHGFRASASTMLNESGKWSGDAIERELAHVEGNAIRRAYDHGDRWEERVRMIQWWADYCDELRQTGQVLALLTRAG